MLQYCHPEIHLQASQFVLMGVQGGHKDSSIVQHFRLVHAGQPLCYFPFHGQSIEAQIETVGHILKIEETVLRSIVLHILEDYSFYLFSLFLIHLLQPAFVVT